MPRLSPWMLVPYPVRVALWVVVLGLLVWAWFELDGALERHYTAEQNTAIAEDAARTNASTARLLEGKNAAQAQVIRERDLRIARMQGKQRDQDDEMARLKRDVPAVAEWAVVPVPDAVRARHGVR